MAIYKRRALVKYVVTVLMTLAVSCRGAPTTTSSSAEKWKTHCKVTTASDSRDLLQCSLYKGQMVDYREIRDWTASKTGRTFAIVFVCAGGSIHLPWPFKAKNVVSLEVKGCILEGFLSEMTTVHVIPDQLKSLVISDASIDVNLRDFFKTLKNINKITKAADCGQITLEKLVFNNIHYDIKVAPEDRHHNIGEMVAVQSENAQMNHAHEHFCKYSNLKYLDESGSRKTGRYHWRLLTENSQFPKLEVYRLANNSLGHVPHDLKHLDSKKFPNLVELDLSNNALEEFEFILPTTPTKGSTKQKLIDLRRNKIRSIPVPFSKHTNIMVDLRENPLQCECKLSSFRQYLKQQYKKVTLRQMVTEITCKAAIKDVPNKIIEYSLMDPSFEKNCVK